MTCIKIIFISLIVLFSCSCSGQTPKEKEAQENALKAAAEAQKQVEEMLKNNPEIKKMMEQGKKEVAKKNAEKKRQDVIDKKKIQEQSNKDRDDFYWKNKIASITNGKFNNWQWGNVSIAIYDGNGKMDSEMQYIDKEYIIVGNVSSNGQITMKLPESITTPNPISKSLIPEMHALNNKEITFSKPNTLFRNPGFSLSIIKNYKKLGDLYIGNSEKVTYNLAAPCCLSYGDEGYRLYWVYIKDVCTASYEGNFERTEEVGLETGITRQLNQTTIYKLDFKPGWNLIKSEIIGQHIYQGYSLYKQIKHTVISNLPEDAKYYFKYNN